MKRPPPKKEITILSFIPTLMAKLSWNELDYARLFIKNGSSGTYATAPFSIFTMSIIAEMFPMEGGIGTPS